MKKLVHSWVSKEDRTHPDDFRKGLLFLYSMIAFLGIILVSTPYMILSNYGGSEVLFGNIFMTCMVLILVTFYVKIGKRIVVVNLLNTMGHLSSIGTYDVGGGIFSSEYYFSFIMCAWIYLVGNKASGLTWFAIVFLTVLFFYYAELMGFKDFKADVLRLDAHYHITMAAFSSAFLALIITLYENGKEKYVKELVQAKAALEINQKALEAHKEDILASINYARRIQHAVLPQEEAIYRSIPLSFIFYKARDIVSGDFFWFHEIDRDNYILVCADCTGHGVPGAMMTVVGSSLLNQTVIDNKITQPARILEELDRLIYQTLRQQKQHEHYVQDGMDLALLKVDKKNQKITFTSAKRPAYFLSENILREIKGSKHTLGGMRSGDKKFEEIILDVKEDDVIYLFTDGITDQFGGPKGKKFSSRKLREELTAIHKLKMADQKAKLDALFSEWKGPHEQVDDVLLIGIKL